MGMRLSTAVLLCTLRSGTWLDLIGESPQLLKEGGGGGGGGGAGRGELKLVRK